MNVHATRNHHKNHAMVDSILIVVLHVLVLYVTLTQMYQHIHRTDMLVRFGIPAGH